MDPWPNQTFGLRKDGLQASEVGRFTNAAHLLRPVAHSHDQIAAAIDYVYGVWKQRSQNGIQDAPGIVLVIDELISAAVIGAKEAVSPITQTELYFGGLNKAELKSIKQHLSLLSQFPLDVSVSIRFLQLMESYSLSHKLSLPDGLLAATALVHNLELYTLNAKDFWFISNLKLYQSISY